MNRTTNTKNSASKVNHDAPATSKNPSKPAIKAITRNNTDRRRILVSPGSGPGEPQVFRLGNMETAGPTDGLNGRGLSENCGGGRPGCLTAGYLRPWGGESRLRAKLTWLRILSRTRVFGHGARLLNAQGRASFRRDLSPPPVPAVAIRITSSASGWKRSRPRRQCVRDTAATLWSESQTGIRPTTARTRAPARSPRAGALPRYEGRRM